MKDYRSGEAKSKGHLFENFVEDYDRHSENEDQEVTLKTIDMALFIFVLLIICIAFIYP